MPAYKIIFCLNRRPDMSVEDFQDYWSSKHVDFVRALPGLQGYEQNHTKLSGYKGRTPIHDGTEKLWFATEAELQAMLASPEWDSAHADMASFVDMTRLKRIVAREAHIVTGEPKDGMARIIEFLTRKEGMSPEDFHAHWENIHGPLVALQPKIRRYVQSHTLLSEYADGAEPDYDGVTEVWFDTTDDMRAAASQPWWQDVLVDEDNFVPKNTPLIISMDQTIKL